MTSKLKFDNKNTQIEVSDHKKQMIKNKWSTKKTNDLRLADVHQVLNRIQWPLYDKMFKFCSVVNFQQSCEENLENLLLSN